MKGSLEKRIQIFAFFILTLAIAVNTGFNIVGFRNDYRDGIILRVQEVAGGLRTATEKVLDLGVPLAEMEGLGGRCQEVVVNDPEITYAFIEDERGRPLYSSDPSFHFASQLNFVSSFSKTVSILNSPEWGEVYDLSLPIYAPSGDVAGRVRVGFLDKVLEERTAKAFRRSLVILSVAFLTVFAVVVYFVRRDLLGPIGRLRQVAREIASGEFRVDVPPMQTAEFAELGQALQEMAASLEQRDQQIQSGYHELEGANQQLQAANAQQGRISAELGRSREMYRALLENASDAIIVSDDDDRVVLVNRAAERFFGIPRSRAEGANLFFLLETLQSVDIEEQYALHEKVLRGESVEAEVHFVRPTDHRPMVGWGLASAVVGQGGKKMVQAVFRDVTREREIKENLERSARDLERLNQMKDSFLGVVSHELKTPLTVILGYSELLLTEMAPRLDATLQPMLRHIANAAERLSAIVRDMTDVSSLDSRSMRLKRMRVDINAVVGEAVDELGLFFEARNLALKRQYAAGLPHVSCDPGRIGQIVINLVGNALKFTPDGGTVTVATRLVESLRVPSQAPDGEGEGVREIDSRVHPYLELSVSDSGIGIADTDQLHVFDKFYEVGSIEEHFTGKTAFKAKGAGLGLTIVKGIVDMHGGEVWVESPGYDPEHCPGSVFYVLLPLEVSGDHEQDGP